MHKVKEKWNSSEIFVSFQILHNGLLAVSLLKKQIHVSIFQAVIFLKSIHKWAEENWKQSHNLHNVTIIYDKYYIDIQKHKGYISLVTSRLLMWLQPPFYFKEVSHSLSASNVGVGDKHFKFCLQAYVKPLKYVAILVNDSKGFSHVPELSSKIYLLLSTLNTVSFNGWPGHLKDRRFRNR